LPILCHSSLSTASVSPRRAILLPYTTLFRSLADIFAYVLGVPTVGVHDDFFRLGGDSITAIQLVNRARAAGLALRVRDVFDRPRSEEHTSELQSREHLVCRLLLEKKKSAPDT